MKKLRTRIICEFEGRSRQLLSLQQASDGTVQIFLNLPSGDKEEPKILRYSVHSSDRSGNGGFNIVTHINERKEDNKYCYINPNMGHKNAIFGAHAYGRLSSKTNNFNLAKWKNDKTINIGKFPYAETLAVILGASKSDLSVNEYNTFGLDSINLDYEPIKIHIIFGFFCLPPSFASVSEIIWTRNPESKEFKELDPDDRVVAKGLSPEIMSYMVIDKLHYLSEALFRQSYRNDFLDYVSINKFPQDYVKNIEIIARLFFQNYFLTIGLIYILHCWMNMKFENYN